VSRGNDDGFVGMRVCRNDGRDARVVGDVVPGDSVGKAVTPEAIHRDGDVDMHQEVPGALERADRVGVTGPWANVFDAHTSGEVTRVGEVMRIKKPDARTPSLVTEMPRNRDATSQRWR
jgi:hypothetical protein